DVDSAGGVRTDLAVLFLEPVELFVSLADARRGVRLLWGSGAGVDWPKLPAAARHALGDGRLSRLGPAPQVVDAALHVCRHADGVQPRPVHQSRGTRDGLQHAGRKLLLLSLRGTAWLHQTRRDANPVNSPTLRIGANISSATRQTDRRCRGKRAAASPHRSVISSRNPCRRFSSVKA